MKKNTLLIITLIVTLVASFSAIAAPKNPHIEKLKKNIKKYNENPKNQDGCLVRKFKVTQVSEGGKWTGPYYLENPGYKDGSYRFISCDAWNGSTSLNSTFSSSGISANQIKNYFCETSYPHLDKSRPIYVRTIRNQWVNGLTNTVPHKPFREMEVACYAASSLRNKCRCK